MRGIHWRLGALGLTLFVASLARAETVTFDFTGEGGVLTSVTVFGSNPSYSATATGKTYASTLSSGVASFTGTPAYASGTAVQIYQHDFGLGVDSDSVS